MENKLQELTAKVYHEGVEKAQQQAAAILNTAQEEASSIVDAAKKEAAQIVAQAQNKASETARNVETEIRLPATQTIAAIKQAIETVLTIKTIEPTVGEAFDDKDFVVTLIKQIADGFVAKGNCDLRVVMSAADLELLDAKLKMSLADAMNKGLTIDVGKVKSGFCIGPKDGSYYVSFSQEDFNNYFKTYLRSKTADMLFGQ